MIAIVADFDEKDVKKIEQEIEKRSCNLSLKLCF